MDETPPKSSQKSDAELEAERCSQQMFVETLRNVPFDGRVTIEVSPTFHRFIPYGQLCHQAADLIDKLRGK